jgi:hypothetical protein
MTDEITLRGVARTGTDTECREEARRHGDRVGRMTHAEIVDAVYDRADECPTCKAMSEWRERYFAAALIEGFAPFGTSS